MNRSFLYAALAAVFLAAVSPARAQTNYSDLWWNAAESGWGVGLQRQGDVIFLTLFVYAPDGSSTWFVAPDVRVAGSASSTWQGALYRADGPGFSGQYDASVHATEAGNATLEFDSADTATVRYSVDGAAVTKRITRMTWREPSATGRYYGGFSAVVNECVDATRVGAYDFLGSMNVTQNGRQVSVAVSSGSTGVPSSCSFTGAATYAGRSATWSGDFTCNIVIGLNDRGEAIASTTRRGTFTVSEVAITAGGVHGSLVAADQDCAFTGKLGGTRLP